jgi:hypothetical protein
LQKGKNKAGRIPPRQSGIKKYLAKYNPEKTRKIRNNLLITDDNDIVMVYVL